MPLAILRKNERDCPCIVCDHCGEEIANYRRGNYQWVMSAEGGNVPRTLHFTHKDCCRAFEAAHPLPEGMMWGAIELGDLRPVPDGEPRHHDRDDSRNAAMASGVLIGCV